LFNAALGLPLLGIVTRFLALQTLDFEKGFLLRRISFNVTPFQTPIRHPEERHVFFCLSTLYNVCPYCIMKISMRNSMKLNEKPEIFDIERDIKIILS
jgi:hypothetical protein